MTLDNATPSPHMSTTESLLGASRQVRRRWSSPRSLWSWPWPPGRQDPALCCSAPETPTQSSSCRSLLLWCSQTLINHSLLMILNICALICVSSRESLSVWMQWEKPFQQQTASREPPSSSTHLPSASLRLVSPSAQTPPHLPPLATCSTSTRPRSLLLRYTLFFFCVTDYV